MMDNQPVAIAEFSFDMQKLQRFWKKKGGEANFLF